MSIFNKSKIKALLEPMVASICNDEENNPDLRKNTYDVFSATIDAVINDITLEEYKEREKYRQRQKTLQNKIGELHQKILGTLDNITDLGTGSVVDLEGDLFIAEIKNKHNTTKGNHKIAIYDDLESVLKKKDDKTIGYYVEILPQNKKHYNKPFTPSDNKTKKKRDENPRIRQIDGDSFYSLVTGSEHALRDVYDMLATSLTEIKNERYGKKLNAKDYIDEKEFDHIYCKK